ncbi:NAD(P)H-quinone oxidoreductase [Cellulomonas sp. HZM]|uniref:NAD(P)H-quinone oxidoreductase n=1 Tax=Cellulomonas sp. HZM TaxID=1454010 RepID=UPI00049385D9|nr:NAD(P)H-quinone oxidoreductase [Cellulomonas sp. HZM]
MRAVVVEEPGGPEVLTPVQVPEPVARPGEELVRVRAAGVNRADLLQRRGLYPPPPGAPAWPGLEVAGETDDGRRVAALLGGGGYAELVAVPHELTLPVPADLTDEHAAALPEVLATVLSTFDAAGLAHGGTVLVRGASGGIGSVAVQVARHAFGARVLATAGGPERVARVAALTVDVALDHRSDDLVRQVLDATGGAGVDLVLDVVGAAALADNLAMLADGGRVAVIGTQRGSRAELDLGLLLARRVGVVGTTLRSRPPEAKARIMGDVRERLWPLVLDGRIRPVLHAALPLERAADAHRMMEAGEVFGKVVLVP